MTGSKTPRHLEIDRMVDRLLEDPATARIVAQRLRVGLAVAARPRPPRDRAPDMDDFWDNMPV